jgi:hypothetical protein
MKLLSVQQELFARKLYRHIKIIFYTRLHFARTFITLYFQCINHGVQAKHVTAGSLRQ